MSQLSEKDISEFLSFCQKYLADLNIPKKRGTFMEKKGVFFYISAIGKDANEKERQEFHEFDQKNHVHQKFINDLKERFKHLKYNYTIVDPITFVAHPEGVPVPAVAPPSVGGHGHSGNGTTKHVDKKQRTDSNESSVNSNPKRILLFDVDGTLTVPRLSITPEMLEFMRKIRQKSVIGVVGGSDLNKITEQLGDEIKDNWDYVFSENGLAAYKGKNTIAEISIRDYFKKEEDLREFISFCLDYISKIQLPAKRAHVFEFRKGMFNISPIGRDCSQQEREDFEQYDKQHKVRETFISVLQKRYPTLGLVYAIGGQISFDAFPVGWDKTFCLRYLEKDFDDIHFFGDKTMEGGNDYAIYTCDRTVAHSVVDPADTRKQILKVLEEEPVAKPLLAPVNQLLKTLVQEDKNINIINKYLNYFFLANETY